jgi:hypothetical protein
MKTFLLGPSHLHYDFTQSVKELIDQEILFKDCILHGAHGLPNWSTDVINKMEENKNKNIIWLVSDYKFNNRNYIDITKDNSSLFMDVKYGKANVNKKFMDTKHIKILGDHTIAVIDYLLKRYKNIKLIFWCLYTRTKIYSSKSIPKYLQYDAMVSRYKNKTIDINLFTDVKNFKKMIRDRGGHPNVLGYKLLSKMVDFQIH